MIRLAARERELAVRTALGATPGALARLSLVESAILALCGSGAGIVLSIWGVALLQLGIAVSAPSMAGALRVGRFVPLVAAVATTLVTIAIGVLPAWSAARRDVLPALAGTGRSSISKRFGYGVGDVLVLLQVGLAVAFVLSTAMMVRVAPEIGRQLRPVVHGEIYVARLVTRGELDRRHQRSVYDSIVDSVAASGGLERVALASEMPGVSLAARSAGGATECRVGVIFVSRTYFETLGLRLERGDVPASGAAAIVSASAARKCWSDASTDEWRMRVNAAGIDGWLPVAGVAPDLIAASPPGHPDLKIGDPAFVWIVGAPEWPSSVYLMVRPFATVSSLTIAQAVGRASSAVAMEPMARLEDVTAGRLRSLPLVLGILVVVGLMALVLASVGVYAALSQSCALRLRELGVRMALGASPSRLVAIAVSRDAPLILVGVVAGVIGTLWVTAIVWRELLMISATDPWLWVVVCAVLTAAALVASLGPALRAIRVDPIAALRAE